MGANLFKNVIWGFLVNLGVRFFYNGRNSSNLIFMFSGVLKQFSVYTRYESFEVVSLCIALGTIDIRCHF